MLGPVSELHLSNDDIASMRRAGWNSVAIRVIEYLSSLGAAGAGVQTAIPGLDEMMTHIANTRPGNLIAFDLETMTLRAWATAFQYSVMDLAPDSESHCPYWMAIVALRALGFAPDAESLSKWAHAHQHYTKRPADEFAALEGEAIRRVSTTELRPLETALVVTKPSNSIVEKWRPDLRFAVLPLSLAQLQKIPSDVWFNSAAFGPRNVVIEMPVDPKEVPSEVQMLGPPYRLYARQPKRDVERFPTDIIAPRNVADLFPDFRAQTR
jgi:hypothetical protein